jgi:hypothetical protein
MIHNGNKYEKLDVYYETFHNYIALYITVWEPFHISFSTSAIADCKIKQNFPLSSYTYVLHFSRPASTTEPPVRTLLRIIFWLGNQGFWLENQGFWLGNLGSTWTIARLCALFKAHSGERAWKATRTGCEGLTIWVGLIMFGKLGTGSKERILGSIPL